MLNRILVALIGIPILITVLIKGGIWLLLFVNIFVLIGLHEFYKMSRVAGKKPDVLCGYLTGIIIPNLIYFITIGRDYLFTPIIFLLLVLIIKKIYQNKIVNSSDDIGITILGVLYVSLLFSHTILLSLLPNGNKWLLIAQILVWISDTSAYFVGVSIGRKFFKDGFSVISPKKSIEGAIGSVIFTGFSLLLIDYYFHIFEGKLNGLVIVLIGILISVVAQLGDLGESMFKREFKIKDSGKILGEHGGVLDRFDSMLFVVPIVYYLLLILF